MNRKKSEVPPAILTALASASLLNLVASAKFLGLTPWQIRGIITRKEIAFIRVGRGFYFRRSTLLRWAERAEEVVR
jgi:excisionase family DNA binding protein